MGPGRSKSCNRTAHLIAGRSGRAIEIVVVPVRSKAKDRGVSLDGFDWYDDPVAMAREADVDVVIELIGGEDGLAKAVCEAAITSGRHVVTANKALLAIHGNELAPRLRRQVSP